MPYLLSIVLGAFSAVLLAWHWPQASQFGIFVSLISIIILVYFLSLIFSYIVTKNCQINNASFFSLNYKSRMKQCCIAWLIFSCAYLVFYATANNQREAWQLLNHSKHDVEVEFTISSLVKYEEKRRSFYAQILSVNEQKYDFLQDTKLKISDYSNDQSLPLQPCDTIKAVIRLKPIRGLANQYSFDFERYAFSQQWQASAYIRQQLDYQPPTFIQRFICINRFRQSFKQWLLKQLPKQDSAWLLALTIGDKTEFDDQQRQFLSASSLAHLFVISGLHVGIVAAWIYFSSLAFAKRIVRSEFFNPLTCAAWLTLLGVGVYVLLVGASLPSLRAFIMLVAVLWGRLSGFSWSLPTRLVLAFCITFLIWPLSLLGMGFWLSYSAVFIIYLYSCLLTKPLIHSLSTESISAPMLSITANKRQIFNKGAFYFKHYLGLQLFIFFMLQPLVYGFNLQLNFLAPLLNVVAIPIVSLIFVPLALILMCLFACYDFLEILGLGNFINSFAVLLSQSLSTGVNVVSELMHHRYLESLTAIPINLPYQQAVVCLVSVACLCLITVYAYRLGLKVIVCINLLLCISFMALQILQAEWSRSKPESHRPESNSLTLQVFDVGQGLAIALHSNHQTWLYDTGSSWPQGSMAASVIAPYLKNKGMRTIDHLMLSHLDNDHAGGLEFLLNHALIKRLTSSSPNELEDSMLPIVNAAKLAQNKILQENSQRLSSNNVCFAGQREQLGDYTIEVFHPQPNTKKFIEPLHAPTEKTKSKRTSKQRNNASCVVLVSKQTQAILLTGDISSAVEKQLLNDVNFLKQLKGKQLTLILAHHGSKYSTSTQWIKKIKPNLAIASAAYLSRFNHPHPDVKARLMAEGVPFLTTASSGQITLIFDLDQPPQIKQQRLSIQDRVWNVAYRP